MLTKCLAFLCILVFVGGSPTKESTLREDLYKYRCVFPPANLEFPPRCSEYTLSSKVEKDMRHPENVEYYLCTALLDSVKRLCILVNGNRNFKQRVSSALNETLTNLMAVNNDDKFCDEMNMLDDNTTMPQAKFMYGRLKSYFCNSICNGFDEKEAALRKPICKSIQFAHQQILAARDLQKSLSGQDTDDAAALPNPVQTAPVNQPSQADSANQDSHINPPDLGSQVESHKVPSKVKSSTNQGPETLPSEGQISNRHESPAVQIGGPAVQSGDPIIPENNKNSGGSHLAVDPAGEPPVHHKESKAGIVESDKDPVKGGVDVAAPPADAGEAGNEGGKPDQASLLDSQTKPEQTERVESNPLNNDPMDPADNVEVPNPAVADEPLDDEGMVPGQETDDEEGSDLGMGNKVQESPKEIIPEKPQGHILEKSSNSPSLLKEKSEGVVSGAYGNFVEAEDSHFFAYFMFLSALCVLGYLVYHNKRKIIAMAVEGKKSRNTGRRRPNSASYHKLDSNLEEAMSSNLASTNSYVIY